MLTMPADTSVSLASLGDGSNTQLWSCGTGHILLMLHGWTLDHRSFIPQLSGLSGVAQCVAFDRRGFGLSTARPDLDREIDDVAAIIDALGGAPVHLLGVSQGGRIALRFASRYPHLLRSLILQGAPLDGFAPQEPASDQIPLQRYRSLLADGDVDTFQAEWLAHPLMVAGVSDSAQQSALREMLSMYRGQDLLEGVASTAEFDVIAQLQTLACPVLTVCGELETVARLETAKQIVSLAPRAQQVEISGAGHLCNLTHAAEYNAVLQRHLTAAD